MDTTQALINQLTAAAAAVGDPPPELGFEVGTRNRDRLIQHRVSANAGEVGEIASLLASNPAVARLGLGRMNFPFGCKNIHIQELAHWLLAQCRRRPSTEVVEELMWHLTENSCPFLGVIPVWGISPISPIDLG